MDQRPGDRSSDRRALGLGLAVIVAFVAILGLGLWQWTRARPDPPFAQMTAIVESFPVEPGMRPQPPERRGDKCGLSPTCEAPMVLKTVEMPVGDPLSCSDLARMVREWERAGFVEDPSDTVTTGQDCAFNGRVGHIYAGVIRLDDRSFKVHASRP